MTSKVLIPLFLLFSFLPTPYAQLQNGLSESYNRSNSNRSGIALGGIGAGSVELRKNGQFYNWSIMNNWPVFTGAPLVPTNFPGNSDKDSYLFFLVRYQVEGESPKIKLLQINDGISEASMESVIYYYPWLSAIEKIEYNGTFPFVNMKFSDSEMPLEISMQAYSPFIPRDVKNSSLPGIFFNYSIVSTSQKPVKVLLVGSLRNLTGYDKTQKYFISDWFTKNNFQGFLMSSGGYDSTSSSYGDMGLFSASQNTSYYLGWEHKHPYYEKLLINPRFENINDTKNRHVLREGKFVANASENNDQRFFSSLGIDAVISPGDTMKADIIMTWNFPNLYGASELQQNRDSDDYFNKNQLTKIQGHYYNNFFGSALDVAEYLNENNTSLFNSSNKFITDFYNSDIPGFVLNQVNSQLNTFITSSTLTKSGKFAIREGLTPSQPWGPNGTIDVSLYGSASTIALFPELQKNMMRVHKSLQTDKGEINHGLGSDLEQTLNGTANVYNRVDLVPNYIQIVLRDFFWTGDAKYLREMWPSVVKGIEYILKERDKDGDMMPDMEGIMCSYDNFPMFGLASYIQSQWLAAMLLTHEAALIMNDRKTANLANDVLEKGRSLMEKNLWNGKYYNLSNDYKGNRGIDNGILTDQLIGQWIIHQAGLGYLLPEENVARSMDAIMANSFIQGFGLRNCTWPEYPDLFPIEKTDLWVDQANTCWSGVELGFAGLLLYENKREDALKVIKTVDDRYRKAGLYWDHQEFGGHYYRPLSAWSIINGYLGLGINNGNFTFDPKIEKESFQLFFSFGNGTASYRKENHKIKIAILSGTITIKSLNIPVKQATSKKPEVFVNGNKVNPNISISNEKLTFAFKRELILNENDVLTIK